MSLVLFLLTVLVIIAIARYNESNKLFWTLVLSTMMGIAGWTFYQKSITSNRIKQDSVQIDPVKILTLENKVSQDATPMITTSSSTISEEESGFFIFEQNVGPLVFNTEVPTNPP